MTIDDREEELNDLDQRARDGLEALHRSVVEFDEAAGTRTLAEVLESVERRIDDTLEEFGL